MTKSRLNVLDVPELALVQTEQGIPCPSFPEPYLRSLRDSGYLALGTVSVISAFDGETQQLLMLHHREYDMKVQPGGAWGFPAETARAVHQEGQIKVENALQTMFRGLREEIGIEIGFPGLQARAIGAYASCAWPRSYYRPDEYAFGVVPIMHMVDAADAERLAAAYQGQKETDDIAFMTPDEIRALPPSALRTGTLNCLEIAERSPFFTPNGPFSPVTAPTRLAQPGSFDVILHNLPL